MTREGGTSTTSLCVSAKDVAGLAKPGHDDKSDARRDLVLFSAGIAHWGKARAFPHNFAGEA
jgi:hypothetical protein